MKYPVRSSIFLSLTELTLSSSGKKLQIKSSQTNLNIQSGSNQVQIISNGARSNAFAFNF